MTLSTLQKKLTNLGFEVVISDNSLQAARETGNVAIEISADPGGEVRIVKKSRKKLKNKELEINKKGIPIVREIVTSETFRTKLETPAEFEAIEKKYLEA